MRMKETKERKEGQGIFSKAFGATQNMKKWRRKLAMGPGGEEVVG